MPLNFTNVPGRKFLLKVYQKMFLKIRRDLVKHSLIYLRFLTLQLFNQRTAPLRENSCKRNHFIEGKYDIENFNSQICTDFITRKTVDAQENHCQIYFR